MSTFFGELQNFKEMLTLSSAQSDLPLTAYNCSFSKSSEEGDRESFNIDGLYYKIVIMNKMGKSIFLAPE